MPSGAYVVPLTLYSETTGPRFADSTTHTCAHKNMGFWLRKLLKIFIYKHPGKKFKEKGKRTLLRHVNIKKHGKYGITK